MTNFWLPLAKNVLAPLTITTAGTAIQKKNMRKYKKSNFNWRNEWYHKTVDLFKDLDITIKGIGETIKDKAKEQNMNFFIRYYVV